MGRAVRVFAVLTLILLFSLSAEQTYSPLPDRRCWPSISGSDTISALIAVEGGLYYSKGFPVGYQYELIRKFSEEESLPVTIHRFEYSGSSWYDSLVCGNLDLVALNITDSSLILYEDSILESIPLNGFVWVAAADNLQLIERANQWLALYSGREEAALLYNRYFRSYSLKPYMESMAQASRISPYDNVIRSQSLRIGWDWRLLAAVIKKESRFSVAAHSKRGAMGLMQVKKSTASEYDVENLLDPVDNIYAGVSHLAGIKRRYENMGLDSANVVKFTLAAYNAGESRIEDCMNFTKYHNGDFMQWDVVSEMIPLMSDSLYRVQADFLRHGEFRGTETITYVEDVLSIYEEYKEMVKK